MVWRHLQRVECSNCVCCTVNARWEKLFSFMSTHSPSLPLLCVHPTLLLLSGLPPHSHPSGQREARPPIQSQYIHQCLRLYHHPPASHHPVIALLRRSGVCGLLPLLPPSLPLSLTSPLSPSRPSYLPLFLSPLLHPLSLPILPSSLLLPQLAIHVCITLECGESLLFVILHIVSSHLISCLSQRRVPSLP